jgi:ribose transport system ATP-binding protein
MSLTLFAQHVVKRYAGVVALAQGDLEARSGEVLALIGANGSGKSTLCKVITGVAAPDEGQLLLNGDRIAFRTPYEAQGHGIAAVYQDLSLIPLMSVAENIWLNHEPLVGILVSRGELRRRTQALINLFQGTVGPGLTSDALVADLPPDERQIVEILKALSTQPKIMILDEATSSLDNRQVTRLFELIAQWKAEGKAIIYISHRMGEILRISDRVTVLRNGKTISDCPTADVNERELVNLMVGSGGAEQGPTTNSVAPRAAAGPVVLEADDLRSRLLKRVSLDVRAGELLGIGGLQGQGQADLLLAIFGAIPFAGEIRLNGKSCHFRQPQQAMAQGIAFVPGDRATEGLLMRSSIFDNLMLPNWTRYGFPLQVGKALSAAQETAASLNVVMDHMDTPVSSLSGGNAQKIVIGKWLQRNPKLLLLNDPTKGVDVGAKDEFYALLAQLQARGAAIVFYSSDDEELVGLCDRVLVMYAGKIRTELAGPSLTLPNLVAASLGASEESS